MKGGVRKFGAAERGLLPEGRIAGPMPWVIAIMMFLTVLAAAAGLGLGGAAARLDADGGQTKIEAIAKAASLGVRSLQTRFLANVGLTPKEFAGVQRLQSTLRALDSETPLADLATDSGFSDQAHATRAIKRVTGLTLSRLRDELRRDRDGTAAIEIAAAFVRGYA